VRPSTRWREEIRRAAFIANAGAREQVLDAFAGALAALVGSTGVVWDVWTRRRPRDPRSHEWFRAVADDDFEWMQNELAGARPAPPERSDTLRDWAVETAERRYLLTIGLEFG
jgi:hypothetical protein